jgi:hypothetical protein
MGATSSSVDVKKFGQELREVISKISEIEPNIYVSSSQDGKLFILKI